MEDKKHQFELTKLISKREYYFSELHGIYESSKHTKDDSQIDHFLVRLRGLEDIKNNIFKLTDQINDLNFQLDEKFIPDYKILKTVEELRLKILEVGSCLDRKQTAKSKEQDTNFKLPKISLAEFSGEITEWPMFYQKFVSIIHNNQSLDDFTKLHYLLSSLKGKALEACAGITPSASNYEILLNALKARFDNKRSLADAYFQKMLELKPVPQESATALSHLVFQFDTAYKSLRELAIPNLTDYFTASLLLMKLDPQTRREFETSKHSKIPSYREVLEFLQAQIEAIAQIPKGRPNSSSKLVTFKPGFTPKNYQSFVSQTPSTSGTSVNNGAYSNSVTQCSICGDSHLVYSCPSLTPLNSADRIKLVNQKNLCMNCLSNKHSTQTCKSLNTCKICQLPHHTLLHEDPRQKNPESSDSKSFCSVNHNSSSFHRSVILLSTAVVLIDTPTGPQRARFLIDTASQSHFITDKFCRLFGLPIKNKDLNVTGIGTVTYPTVGLTHFVLTSMFDSRVRFEVSALVVKKITDRLPNCPISVTELGYLQTSVLADSTFFEPGPVDGILGAEIFTKILGTTKIVGPAHLPVALETSLGFIIMGKAPIDECESQTDNVTHNPTVFCSFSNKELLAAVHRFWELEEVPTAPEWNDNDLLCESLFAKTTTRDPSGRYCVSLPFKDFPPKLGDSRKMAEKRHLYLEQRFKKLPNFFSQYAAVVRDYINQGHMTIISNGNDDRESNYLPHFAVLKDSSSTPLRIVFDASAKTENLRSLNSTLHKGPKLQNDIVHLLLNFRTSPVALIADVRQMYRNILILPAHRRFQRILWRFSPSAPLDTYELNCVVFGMTSAPYLALRTLKQLAIDERSAFPIAAALTEQCMYVDDLVVSLNTTQEAVEAYSQLVGLFTAGGFKLTKWASNHSTVLENIPPEDRLSSHVEFHDSSNLNDCIKILGLKWDAPSDTFLFAINNLPSKHTKRGILSSVARIWDPLGFLAPCTFHVKFLIKQLWMANIGWDDELPPTLLRKWSNFLQELSSLSSFRVPRCYSLSKCVTIALIGFADSSEKGYGAVAYLRATTENSVKVTLLGARSKVSPMKTCSLPRLELCATLLLAKWMKTCEESLASKINIQQKYAFTDSMVALFWIKNEPYRWKTFVANRVAKIQTLVSQESWFHVKSENNIADCISRGLTPKELLELDDWLHGPKWLRSDVSSWPIQSNISIVASEEIPESKASQFCSLAVPSYSVTKEWLEALFQRFSSLNKLLRTIVYVFRFTKRVTKKQTIDCEDIEFVEKKLIRQVQHCYFEEDIRQLKKNGLSSVNIRHLSPYLEDDIICVGGRLSNADIPHSAKHPFLLPRNSYFSCLVVDNYHRANFHTGPNLVLALTRQRFWIPGARNLIRKRIRTCNTCFKVKPQSFYPLMAPLPKFRVLEAKPFLHSGVDYAGPFQITIVRRRGIKSQKAYLCLFICMATKAVHLEAASSLSTESFLACFKRFVARRGPVKFIYSDHGTNFIGAKNQLNDFYNLISSEDFQSSLRDQLTGNRIVWKLNPPSAPHFGGIWEANIRSVKAHLNKTLGTQILTYEEFYTVLTQVEAILNSRPLCSLSSDPSDPDPLTPAHFLTLSPLRQLPAMPELLEERSLKNRKCLLDLIVTSFWKRWKEEYLTSLHRRSKWSTPTKDLSVGTVVLVRQENTPPLNWPLGVVEHLHPGNDGVVRVVTVRMGQSQYIRPVTKLCPLPTQ